MIINKITKYNFDNIEKLYRIYIENKYSNNYYIKKYDNNNKKAKKNIYRFIELLSTCFYFEKKLYNLII